MTVRQSLLGATPRVQGTTTVERSSAIQLRVQASAEEWPWEFERELTTLIGLRWRPLLS